MDPRFAVPQAPHAYPRAGRPRGPTYLNQDTMRNVAPPRFSIPPPGYATARRPGANLFGTPALRLTRRQQMSNIGRPAQQTQWRRPAAPRIVANPPLMLSLDRKYYVLSTLVKPRRSEAMNAGVYRVRDPLSGFICVEKLVRVDQPGRREALNRELEALYKARDSHAPDTVNRIISHFEDPTRKLVSITLDYCSSGSLSDLIDFHKQSNISMSSSALFNVAWSLARALSFLHYGIRDLAAPLPSMEDLMAWNGILHLDIKPENVFLKPNPGSAIPYRVILGDLGCSVTHRDFETGAVHPHEQGFGTEGWFPPENIHSPLFRSTQQAPRGYYGRRTDVWQVGGVVQCMGTLQQQPVQEMIDVGIPLGPERMYGDAIEGVVAGCMARSLQVRFTAPQLGNIVRARAWEAGERLEM